VQVLNYHLPDFGLLQSKINASLVWIPDKTYIVLGASNRAESALHVNRVEEDGISVLKRPSGGQTVMLTSLNIVIATVLVEPIMVQPKDVFDRTNRIIVSVLESFGLKGLHLTGISDIAINEKKILGSAIYRKKNVLLYHAVLNVAEPASTFEHYLQHPQKEPDYRQGRTHADFVTSLCKEGFSATQTQLQTALEKALNR
jgi:lipoate-protein ligase A